VGQAVPKDKTIKSTVKELRRKNASELPSPNAESSTERQKEEAFNEARQVSKRTVQ